MRVVIDRVEIDNTQSTPVWRIIEHEIQEVNDPVRIWGTADESGVVQMFPLQVGQAVEHVHQMPYNLVLHRAAEYGIDPGDIDTLLDIAICERFIAREWWEGDDHLFAAGSIDEARRLYLAEIARIKLKYRITTRRRGGIIEQPLEELRQAHTWKPADLALKSIGVLLHRHRIGAQELEPTVLKALTYMEKALATRDDTDDSVSTEGFTNG